jgi:hypothetical protein
MIGVRENGLDRLRVGPAAVCLALLVLLAGAGSAAAEPSKEPFEIVPGSFKMALSTLSSTGAPEPDNQAGAHADWTFTFDFAHNKEGRTHNDLKDTVINVPAGFMGNADRFAFPTCRDALLVLGVRECPADSQVGTITLDLRIGEGMARDTAPVYNMEVNSFGVTAELGFNIGITQVIPITVRPQDSGITSTAPKTQDTGEPHDVSVTIWGVPAASVHDPERGRACIANNLVLKEPPVECEGGGEKANVAVTPFLANPTSCGMFTATMKADSWEEPQPESWLSAPVEVGLLGASTEVAPITGCERLHFDPSLKVVPTTDSAESPSGLDVSLEVPQTWESPNALATSNVRDVKVTLPQGYTVNPSEGNGLEGCTPAQYAVETASSPQGAGCPPKSKVGEVEIETPVLAEKIAGNVYLATPYDNVPAFGDEHHPNGSLLALYVVAKAPDRGIIVKSAGKVETNETTGQLTSTFSGLPQQPFSKVTFKLTQGEPSPLVSPPACGRYIAQAELTPSSAESEPRFVSNELGIEAGIGGGPCPAGGIPPFKPAVVAGTQSNSAASYSPFYLRIIREDGEQEITRFSTTLPPGLTGNLTGIPFCPDAAIEAARSATGHQELSASACPAASEIGHTLVGAGVGSVLAWTPGKVYLAGPYHGSALSIVSVTSATVGPFDLGTVVIRFALRINPITAQVEVDATGSDPIPHIIQGIVVHVRDIHVYVDRAKFILNPTSCDPMSISDTVTGAGADFTNPADQVPVTLTSPFQAADCASLHFKPVFKVSASGKTSRANGASLSVKLTYPNAPQGTQANIRYVKVDLPKQLPSRLTTLQKACTAAQFNTNPAGCPAASVVGHATAITPLIPVPLAGPAYFVSHGGEAFPSLIVVLQGYGITIDLVGSTFISKSGITSSTFKTVPDQPVGSFELTLPEGKYSALAANGNLCSVTNTVTVKKKVTVRVKGHKKTVTRKVKESVAGSLTMPTAFVAQNGAVIHQSTPISVTGCAKAKPAKKAKKHKKAGKIVNTNVKGKRKVRHESGKSLGSKK